MNAQQKTQFNKEIKQRRADRVRERRSNVISALKIHKRLSTSNLGGILGMDHYHIMDFLEDMIKEKIIKKVVETRATYWELV